MKVNSFSTQLSWKDWVKEMLHGKAITFYVYIILFGVNTFGEFYFGVTLLLRMLFFMVGIFTIGGLVDTVAHLYLGRNQSGLDAPAPSTIPSIRTAPVYCGTNTSSPTTPFAPAAILDVVESL